ncbi:tyrosine-protein kinase SRK3-like [Ptychodera flava]|uniref:tyrosine-protein kinase SRK3-like n=1 Tax=Ptychodera flava TaxID=63121 RepID=UPI00396A0BC8
MKRSASLEALNREGSQLPNPYDNALISSDHAIDMETLSPSSPIVEGGNIPNPEIAMTKNLSHFLPARELQRDELENKEQLGGGHYGLVNRALLHRNIDGQRVAIKVAVKSLRNFYDVDNTESFRKELKVLTSLKQHQNVITLLGYCTNGDPKLLVFEFAPHGDLVKYLRNHEEGLSNDRLVKFALDITKGMEYLSSKSIIHRDLAARNILVGEREICKIADFGLSRVGEIYSPTAQTEIPVFWTAPECIDVPQPIYNQKTDVWSFGVVVWEIMSFGRRPFYEGTSSGVVEWLKAGNRLNQPDRCPDNVYEVMNKCWKWNQKERPKFKKLTKEIDSIHCNLANYLVTATIRTLPRYSRSNQYEDVNYGDQPEQVMESSIVEDRPGGSHG